MSESTASREGRIGSVSVVPPINWRRDVDGELAKRAEGFLRKSGYRGLRRVSCDAREGVLVLRGHVSSFYLKQLAQELVRRIGGGETIVNKVEVCGGPAT